MTMRWLATLGVSMAPLLLLGAAPSPSAPVMQHWEHGRAQIQLNRARMLLHRLGKQNLLYQLRLADVQKRDLVDTAEEMDGVLGALRLGSPSLGVPAPPTPAMRGAMDAFDSAWGPLRRLAVSNPFDYASSARIASERGSKDPLLIRHFDDLVEAADTRAVAAQDLYLSECLSAKYPDCEAVARATTSGMLSERMVKEALLVIVGFDVEANAARLRKSRETMDQVLAIAADQEQVQSAMAPARGKVGEVVGGLWTDIGGNWQRLSRDVDLVLEGKTDDLDIGEMVAVQNLFLADVQRFTVAVQRFATARRTQAGAPQ